MSRSEGNNGQARNSFFTDGVFSREKENEPVTDELSKRKAGFDMTIYKLRNLWTKKDIGTTAEPLTAEVP